MDSLKDFPFLHTSDFKISETVTDEQLQDVCSQIKERTKTLIQKNPEVSIIFPAFNEESYLPLMLWTLSKLTTKIPVEIIWVNNASSDRTGEIIEQCGITRIDETRKWVSYARQTWLQVATGTYIATTDADTQVPKKWIDTNLAYFHSYPELVCLSGGSVQKWAHFTQPIARKCFRKIRNTIGKRNTAMDMFYWHNSFYRRDTAIKIWGYEPWSDLWEDTLIARKMKQYGEIARIYTDPEVVVSTSARRVWTFLKVLKTTMERAYLIYHATDPLWKTFSDIR